MNFEEKVKGIQQAIKYYEYGVKCDIFQGDVKRYAELAIDALKLKKSLLKGEKHG